MIFLACHKTLRSGSNREIEGAAQEPVPRGIVGEDGLFHDPAVGQRCEDRGVGDGFADGRVQHAAAVEVEPALADAELPRVVVADGGRVRIQEWSQHRPHKGGMGVRSPHDLGLRVRAVLLCFWGYRCRKSWHGAGGAARRRHYVHRRRGCGRGAGVAETTMLAAGIVFGWVEMARRRGLVETRQS